MHNRHNIIYRKVSKGFQVTLPPEFRHQQNLEEGSTVSMEIIDNKLIVEPYIDQKTETIRRLRFLFDETDKIKNIAKDEDSTFQLISEERRKSRNQRLK